ncbi:hypothetical protein ACQ4LE_006919 [Meloidogyne hapla]
MSTNNSNVCVDPSRLTLAIFGAIFGTLLLCTGFALAVWYLVRNHQFADKLLFPEAAGQYNKRRKKQQQQKTENEAEAAEENNIEEITSTPSIQNVIVTQKTENNIIEKSTEYERKNQIVLEMNEIKQTTKIVEVSPQTLSPREEEIYGTAEEYQRKRIIPINKNYSENSEKCEELNNEKNRKIENEEKMEGDEKKKEEEDKMKNKPEINGKKFMSEIAAAAVASTINGNSIKKNEGNEIKQITIGSPKNGKLKEEKLERIKEDEEYSKNNLNGWAEKGEENIEEENNEELVPEHLRSMLSEEQFGMLEANKRRLEQERRQLRELGVIF